MRVWLREARLLDVGPVFVLLVDDEGLEAYVCTKDLDEDEMYSFITKTVRDCPYFREYDEYRTVRKQN